MRTRISIAAASTLRRRTISASWWPRNSTISNFYAIRLQINKNRKSAREFTHCIYSIWKSKWNRTMLLLLLLIFKDKGLFSCIKYCNVKYFLKNKTLQLALSHCIQISKRSSQISWNSWKKNIDDGITQLKPWRWVRVWVQDLGRSTLFTRELWTASLIFKDKI